MAKIYEKIVGDKTLILEPREGFMRPFDFGTEWTEMRFGFYYGIVTAAGDNTGVSTSENITQASYIDRCTIGLKSNTGDIPGVAGTNFVGLVTNGNWAIQDQTFGHYENLGNWGNRLNGAMSIGATFTANARVNGTTTATYPGKTNVEASTGYNGFMAVKFVISDRGLPTQTIAVSTAMTQNVSGTDYSTTALRTAINGGTYNSCGTAFNWFNATPDPDEPYDIPDTIWIRVAGNSHRIRISAIAAVVAA